MSDKQKLYILWTNADPCTAQFMVMMYATNSMINKWWDEVTVIIWGATAQLVSENNTIKEHIKMARQVGVQFSVCEACARQLGVTEKLKEMDIEVKYWGEPLTELLKTDGKLLTV